VLLTAWSMSMLPRARDVAVAMQTSVTEQIIPPWK
jgi:hypothetical protein